MKRLFVSFVPFVSFAVLGLCQVTPPPTQTGTTTITGGGTSGTPAAGVVSVQGPVADAGTNTGAPVPIGIHSPTGIRWAASTNNVSPGDGGTRILASAPWMRGSSTGFDPLYHCPNTASISVTAANTTEIIAATASQNIRICSISISMSAAGTAQLKNGTGTDCGTGTTNISGAMNLATGTPLSLGSGIGAVVTVPTSNAFCIAAVTGNVNGWVSFVKF